VTAANDLLAVINTVVARAALHDRAPPYLRWIVTPAEATALDEHATRAAGAEWLDETIPNGVLLPGDHLAAVFRVGGTRVVCVTPDDHPPPS
jgi:hypothetical protein